MKPLFFLLITFNFAILPATALDLEIWSPNVMSSYVENASPHIFDQQLIPSWSGNGTTSASINGATSSASWKLETTPTAAVFDFDVEASLASTGDAGSIGTVFFELSDWTPYSISGTSTLNGSPSLPGDFWYVLYSHWDGRPVAREFDIPPSAFDGVASWPDTIIGSPSGILAPGRYHFQTVYELSSRQNLGPVSGSSTANLTLGVLHIPEGSPGLLTFAGTLCLLVWARGRFNHRRN